MSIISSSWYDLNHTTSDFISWHDDIVIYHGIYHDDIFICAGNLIKKKLILLYIIKFFLDNLEEFDGHTYF